jgi:hypothetical protein
MNKKLIGFGILGIALFYLLGKKKFATNALFSLEKIGFDIKARKIIATLGISNPTSTSANIKSIVGALYLKGKQVANVSSFQNVSIQPNGMSFIKLDLKPSLLGLYESAKELIKKEGLKNLNATFIGSANVDGFNLPIKAKLS